MYDKLKIDKIVPVYYIISGQKRQSPVQVSDIVIDQAAAAGPAQHTAPVAGQQRTDGHMRARNSGTPQTSFTIKSIRIIIPVFT